MTTIDRRKLVQSALGVTADGVFGPKTRAAFDALAVATDEAQPAEAPTWDRVDDRSEKAIATLHPRVQPLARQLVRNAAAAGIVIKVTSGLRTYDEQDALYAQGRSRPGKVVTNARGGYSNHNFGTAFDVTIFDGSEPVWDSPQYKTVGKLGKALGLEWGGDWASIQDEPHFELKPDWADGMSESAMLSGLRERRQEGRDAFA